MANTKIKILRGLKKDLPLLDRGEIAFCTDTEEFFAGDGEKNILLSGGGGGEVDLNEMAYFNFAGSLYGTNYSLFLDAWEHSLTVDPLEISEDGNEFNMRGKAQYPTGETEGVIIPQGVTSIGNYAFAEWESNNQPLVIPNSVTSMGWYAFYGWSSNTNPLVIPESVTYIEYGVFDGWSNVPYVEILAITPPTLGSHYAFGNQNDAPIYVPDESVDDYKTATNWVDLADRIFPISSKLVDNGVLSDRVDNLETRVDDVEDDVTELQTSKQNKLIAGNNITINENTNVISAIGGGEGGGGGGSFYTEIADIELNDTYDGTYSLQSDTVYVELIAHRMGVIQGTMFFSKASLNRTWMGSFPWTGEVVGILKIYYSGDNTFTIDWNDDNADKPASNLTIIEHRFIENEIEEE